MYREYFYLIEAYIKSLNKKEFYYDILLPFFVSIIIVLILKEKINKDIVSSIINLMAIILGFIIATITILLTSDNKNLNLSKTKIIPKKILGKELTLYRLLLILFFYIAFVSLIELIISLSSLYFHQFGTIMSIINIFFILHLILLSIRNLTNLFFIEFK